LQDRNTVSGNHAAGPANAANALAGRTAVEAATTMITEENVRTVAQLEQQFRRERTPLERLGDAIGSFAGTMAFVVLHLVWFTVWITWNLKLIPGLPVFDPYPFILLSLTVSCEAVVLSAFVLMKQNRLTQVSEQRNHLNLQVDILAEQEITKVLQTLKVICAHLNIPEALTDARSEALTEETKVEALAEKVKDTISPE
jgi:uncharacterized membrane protein